MSCWQSIFNPPNLWFPGSCAETREYLGEDFIFTSFERQVLSKEQYRWLVGDGICRRCVVGVAITNTRKRQGQLKCADF